VLCSWQFALADENSSLNVIKARRARGDKSRGALLGLVPFFVTWTLIPAYLYLNPEILYNHLVPFVFFAGLVNAYSVGQIITAHLVKLDFPYYNVLVLPIAYGVFDSVGPFLQKHIGIGWPSALGDGGYQVAYMFSMLGMAIGVYGSFVVSFSGVSVPNLANDDNAGWCHCYHLRLSRYLVFDHQASMERGGGGEEGTVMASDTRWNEKMKGLSLGHGGYLHEKEF
jgi:hypothetical protein